MNAGTARTSERISDWFANADREKFLSLNEPSDQSSHGLLADPQQGVMLLGLPDRHFRCPTGLQDYLFWFPGGIPSGRSTLLASSRIGNQPEADEDVLDPHWPGVPRRGPTHAAAAIVP